MIRAEALARGRLFTRCLILLAALLATCALVADALASGVADPVPAQPTAALDDLILPLEQFQQPMPEPLEGWEVAIGTADLFAVFDPSGWPFGPDGAPNPIATTEADLAFGGLCFLIAGLLLWVARRQRPLVWRT